MGDEKGKDQLLTELKVLNHILSSLINAKARKKQGGRLAGSERNFIDVVLDAAGALIVVYDHEGRILCFNRACEEATGYTFKEVVGRPVWNILALDGDDKKAKDEFDDLKGGNVSVRAETFWATKSGRKRLITWEYTVLSQSEEKDGHVIGIGIDLTDHKLLEENLRDSEKKYRTLIETANDAIFIADAGTGIILDANKKAADLIGLPSDKIIGMHQSQLHPEEEAPRYRAIFQEAVRTGGGIDTNLFVRHRDGHAIPVDISASVTDIGGKQIIQGIFRDIRDKRESEAILRKSEERYRHLLETVNDGLGITDSTYVFTYVNNNFCEMLGYDPQELIGHELIEFIHDDHKELMRNQMARRRKGEAKKFELAWRSKDGEKIHTIASPRAIMDSEGRFTESMGILTNITERKKVEEALRKSEERYLAVVENIPVMVCRYLPDGTLTFVNREFCNYFQKSREELINHDFFQLIPDNDQEKVRDHLMSLNKDKPMVTYEHQLIAPDGIVRLQQWTDRAIFDEGGMVVEFQSAGLDIAGTKQELGLFRESGEQ